MPASRWPCPPAGGTEGWSTSDAELHQEFEQADALPYGFARSAALERVVVAADAAGEENMSLRSRLRLTQAYQLGAEPQKAFATFAWCLGTWRSAPERFDASQTYSLLWQFKFVIESALNFPAVSLDQTRALLDDMEDEYRRAGTGLQPVHHYRHLLARHIGDTDAAEREFDRWLHLPRDRYSDCRVCDPQDMASWHIERGRHDEALAVSREVLFGAASCSDQPHCMQAVMLPALVRLGHENAAARAHLESYRAVRTDRDKLRSIGGHLGYCALTGNLARGLEILERHLSWLDDPRDPVSLLDALAGGIVVLRRLSEQGRGRLAVTLPDGETTVDELLAAWTERSAAITADFDARNGTTHQSDYLRRRLAVEPFTSASQASQASPAPAGSASAPPPMPAAVVLGAVTGIALSDVSAPDAPEESTDIDVRARYRERWRLDTPARSSLFAALAVSGDPATDGYAACGSGIVAWNDGDLAAAIAHLDRAVELLRNDDPVQAAQCDVSSALASLLRLRQSAAAADPASLVAPADRVVDLASGLMRASGTPASVRADVALRAAGALALTDRADDAESLLRATADELSEPLLRAELVYDLARLLASRGRLDEAEPLADEAVRLRHELPYRAAEARTLLGRLRADLGDTEGAVSALEAALAHPGELGPEHPRGHLGRALLHLGRRDEAVVVLSQAVAELRAAGLGPDAARTAQSLAAALLDAGRTVEAAEVLEAALPVYADGAEPFAAAVAAALLAEALIRLDGEAGLDDAVARADSALPVLIAEQAWPDVARVQEAIADGARRAGRWGLAVERYGELVALADAHGGTEYAVEMRVSLAECRLRQDPARADDVVTGVEDTIAAAELDDSRRGWWRAELSWRRACVAWDQYDPDDATDGDAEIERWAARAEQGFREVDDRRAAGRCAVMRGESILWNVPVAARDHLQRAVHDFAAVGDDVLGQRARALLAEATDAAADTAADGTAEG